MRRLNLLTLAIALGSLAAAVFGSGFITTPNPITKPEPTTEVRDYESGSISLSLSLIYSLSICAIVLSLLIVVFSPRMTVHHFFLSPKYIYLQIYAKATG